MTRNVTETIAINDNQLAITVATSDGLTFDFAVPVLGAVDVKDFETALKTARTAAYERRVWLNKRKSLTLDEINQLLGTEAKTIIE